MSVDGFTCQFGVVVLLAEVAEPYLSQIFMEIGCEGFGSLYICQVTVARGYALFEQFWIAALTKHFAVVVGFYYEIVAFLNVCVYVVGNCSYIGHDAERLTIDFDEVTYVFRSVVGE